MTRETGHPSPPPAAKSSSYFAFLASGWAVGFAAILVTVTVLLWGVRLLFPAVEHFRPEVARWAGELLGQRLTIGGLEATWHGWTPELEVTDVRLYPNGGGTGSVELSGARFTIDPLASLFALEPQPGRITINEVALGVTRQAAGSLTLGTAGKPDHAETETDEGAFVQWLLRQEALHLESARVEWRDERFTGNSFPIENMHLRVENRDGQRSAEASVTLPEGVGKWLAVTTTISGDPTTSGWNGEIGLQADEIDVAGFLPLKEALGERVEGGKLSVDLRSTWVDARLQGATGQFRVRKLVLTGLEGSEQVDILGGRLSLVRVEDGWKLVLSDLTVATARGRWPRTRAEVVLTEAGPEKQLRITGDVGFVKMEDLWPILAERLLAPGAARGALELLRPQGKLADVQFVVSPPRSAIPDQPLDFHVEGRLLDAAISPAGNIPGLSGVAGRFRVSAESGVVDVDSHGLTLETKGLWDEPVALSRLKGKVEWSRNGAGWEVKLPVVAAENQDLAARASGTVSWAPGDETPFVDLVAAVDRGDLTRLGVYLPKQIRPKAADWLRRSIKAGQVVSGAALLRGPLNEFPFDQGQGRFSIHAEIKDGVLDYSPAWPPLREFSGDIEFNGRAMRVDADGGRLHLAEILHASAVLDDLGAPDRVLTIRGRTTGETRGGLQFIQDTPLAESFGHLTKDLDAQGNHELDLTLTIRLGQKRAEVDGSAHLVDNTLRSETLGISLDGIQGKLAFSNDGIHAKGVKARYLGKPVLLDLRRAAGETQGVQLGMRGRAGRELLNRQLGPVIAPAGAVKPDSGQGIGPALLSRIDGNAAFEATLELPEQWGESETTARLHLTSDLQGMALNWPAPLGKPADTTVPLRLETRLQKGKSTTGERAYTITLSDVARIRLEYGRGADGLTLKRGLVAFDRPGDGDEAEARLPEKGLRVSGSAANLSVDDWLDLLNDRQDEPGPRKVPQRYAGLSRLSDIDVHAEHLEALGQVFKDTQLALQPQAGGAWSIQFDGPELAGQIDLPAPDTGASVVADLERLALVSDRQSGVENRYRPADLPSIELDCETLTFDGRPLGTVVMRTSPQADGMQVKWLSIQSPHFGVKGTGTWEVEGENHSSWFDIDVEGDDLGALLEAFGYEGGAADGGRTRLLIQGTWAKPPLQFALKDLIGTLDFEATDGRLVDVNPGAGGRIFGLLSLTALRRRLTLDFTDLFKKGFSYDKIEGRFKMVGDGNAYTTNLRMTAPTVDIDVSRRTGLVDEDYDLDVTVTPKLSTSLPLALIGLTETLLKKKFFDEVFSYHYSVTGPWSDPKVERVKAEGEPSVPAE